MKKNQKSRAANTGCNPLPIPQIPRGKDDWYPFEHGMFSHENKPESVKGPDYRTVSDPTVFYHDGKWYLYPSYGMAWVSEDFANWKHVRTEPATEFHQYEHRIGAIDFAVLGEFSKN